MKGKNNPEIVELGRWVNMTVSHNLLYDLEEIPNGDTEQHKKSPGGMERTRTQQYSVINLPKTLQTVLSFLGSKLP